MGERQPPGQGLGNRDGTGDLGSRVARRAARRHPLGTAGAVPRADARRRAAHRVGPPVAALRPLRLLRLAALQPHQRPPRPAGRGSHRLEADMTQPTPEVSGPTVWTRFVAIGDSFTEGMCDDDPTFGHDGEFAGWADRLASHLSEIARADGLDFGYANLAVRGRKLADVVGPQLEDALARIRATGADVLMATPVDPADAPLVKATRGRAAIHTANIWSIARRNGAHVIDQWGLHALRDWRMWSEDRIHMTTEGHRRVALAALEALGHTPAETDWATP